ncbi:MAG TPA: c-type cytochrome [Methylocella sp.]|nr:c-type cytochrome [Methylocella sp.]
MTLTRIGLAALTALCAVLAIPASAQEKDQTSGKQSPTVWTVPDIDALPDDARGQLARRGRDLMTMTYAYIGPHAADRDTRFGGNNLACGNCHLEAGTKKFGLPIYGLYWDFPRYSARTGTVISIDDRINSCMTRSMNGRPLPMRSPDMQALVAYIKFLSSGVVPGEQVPGHGAGTMADLDRAADPKHGKLVYARACLDCHNTNGSGIARSPQAMSLGYAVPPLWGDDSFNDGAGMARLITLANFLHSNMPHGADYRNPMLSEDEAWDVAAYVESQARPHKSGLDRDFSKDLLDKPVDTAYGPYADHFSEAQHKYGPFAPIRAEIERLKGKKEKAH